MKKFEQYYPNGSLILVDKKVRAKLPDSQDLGILWDQLSKTNPENLRKLSRQEFIEYWLANQVRECSNCDVLNFSHSVDHNEYELFEVSPDNELNFDKPIVHVCERRIKLSK